MTSVMQDDNALVYGNGLQRERALDRMKMLGVDAIRVTVLWQAMGTRRKPRNGADPKSYPAFHWDRVDDLVKSATRRGIQVYLSVTGPGPKWAHAKSPDSREPRHVEAQRQGVRPLRPGGRHPLQRHLHRRELGQAAAPARGAGGASFNEPNQGGWLTPQAQKKKRRARRRSRSRPRSTATCWWRARRGLIRSGHGDDLILMAETAPLGVKPESERRPLRPALFLRELFCLDNRLRRFRGRQASGAQLQDRQAAVDPRAAAAPLVRPPPLHQGPAAQQARQAPRRDHHRQHRHAPEAARPHRAAHQAHPATACRSCSPSSATRPTRPT